MAETRWNPTVVDFATPLEAVYKRQMRQLEEWTQLKNQQLEQAARADQDVAVFSTIKTGLETVEKITAAVPAIQDYFASKEGKADDRAKGEIQRALVPEDIDQYSNNKRKSISLSNKISKLNEQIDDADPQNKNLDKWRLDLASLRQEKRALDKSGLLQGLSADGRLFLEKNNGYYKVHLDKILLQNRLAAFEGSGPGSFTHKMGDGSKEGIALRTKYDSLTTAAGRQDLEQDWEDSQLGAFGFSPELLKEVAAPRLANLRQTRGIRGEIGAQNVLLSAQQQTLKEKLQGLTYNGPKANQISHEAVEILKDYEAQVKDNDPKVSGKTDIQVATQLFAADLIQLANESESNSLTTGQLTKVVKGLIDHPAGIDLAGTVFSGDRGSGLLNRIVEATNKSALAFVKKQETRNEQFAAENFQHFSNPKNWSKQGLELAIGALRSKGAKDAIIKPLESLLNSNQSEADKEAQLAIWLPRLQRANVTKWKEEAKGISHVGVRNLVIGEIGKMESAKRTNIYHEGWITELVGKASSNTWDKDKDLSAKAIIVQNSVLQYFQTKFAELTRQRKEGTPEYNEIQKDAVRLTQEWWAANGGGNTKGEGRFATNRNKGFVNIDTYDENVKKGRAENQALTSDNFTKWDKKISTEIQTLLSDKDITPENVINKLLDKPGSLIDTKDIIGIAETGRYSEEILVKARLLNVLPSVLVERQFNAMKTDKDYKEDIELHRLENFTITDPMRNIENILAGAEGVEASTMLAEIRTLGLNSFTTNRLIRLHNILEKSDKENYVQNTYKSELVEKVNRQKNQKNKSTQSPVSETENTPLTMKDAEKDFQKWTDPANYGFKPV